MFLGILVSLSLSEKESIAASLVLQRLTIKFDTLKSQEIGRILLIGIAIAGHLEQFVAFVMKKSFPALPRGIMSIIATRRAKFADCFVRVAI